MMWFLSPHPPLSLNPTELGWVVFFIAIFLLSCGPLIQLLPADRQTDGRISRVNRLVFSACRGSVCLRLYIF